MLRPLGEYAELLVLVRIAVMAKEGQRTVKRFTFVMLKVAVRSTEKRRICVLICGGTRENDLLFVTGCFAANGSPDLTNFNDTGEHTPERKSSRVLSVAKGS